MLKKSWFKLIICFIYPVNKCLNANNCWHFYIDEQIRFHAKLSWAWKSFIIWRPGNKLQRLIFSWCGSVIVFFFFLLYFSSYFFFSIVFTLNILADINLDHEWMSSLIKVYTVWHSKRHFTHLMKWTSWNFRINLVKNLGVRIFKVCAMIYYILRL